MRLREISNPKELSKFVKFPLKLYKATPHYVPPLIRDEVNTLWAHHDVGFKDARARFWVVESKGRIVGRIAGIIKPCDSGSSQMEARFGWWIT